MNSKTALSHLSSIVLHQQTLQAAHAEKSATRHLLVHLAAIDGRKVYLERGYSSLFTYIRDALAYSDSAAWERMQATRLLTQMPELAADLQQGKITLTNLAKSAAVINRAERFHKKQIPMEKKLALIQEARTQSKRGLEKVLFKTEIELGIRPDTQERTLTIQVNGKTLDMLDRYSELKGRLRPGEVLEQLLTDFLKRKDPCFNRDASPQKLGPLEGEFILKENSTLQEFVPFKCDRAPKNPTPRSQPLQAKKTEFRPQIVAMNLSQEQQPRTAQHRLRLSPPLNRPYILAKDRKLALKIAKNQCQFEDTHTGKRCEAQAWLHFDHYPVKFRNGGTSVASNLRILCSAHNLFEG